MITIKCTESEKRKLCNDEASTMCNICYALGACKEFDGHCSKCKKHRSKYVQWDIISKPKKKNSEGDGSSCYNCYWRDCGRCICTDSEYFLKDCDEVKKVGYCCEQYSAYEGDG